MMPDQQAAPPPQLGLDAGFPLPIDITGITSEFLMPYKIAGGIFVASACVVAVVCVVALVLFCVIGSRRGLFSVSADGAARLQQRYAAAMN